MIRKNIFIQMFTGEDGIGSSKRGVMIFFVLLFAFTVIYNLVTGKAPSQIYQEQLFELVIITLALVFGEKVMDGIKSMKGGKQTTETTIVSPEQPVVTTITKTTEPKKDETQTN